MLSQINPVVCNGARFQLRASLVLKVLLAEFPQCRHLPMSLAGRRWIVAMLLGELVGFIPPAVTGATLAAVGASDGVLVVGLTIAGLLEGAAIGGTQVHVLRHHAPLVNRRNWVVATVAAAGFAWFVGMGGGALMGADVVAPALLVIILVPAWTAAL